MERDATEFINDLCKGKHAAQQRLLSDYGPLVFRLVVRMVGRIEDAEEVCQDVFVKALTKIATFNPQKAALNTWLTRIAYNEAVNHLRRSTKDIIFSDFDDMGDEELDTPFDSQHDEMTILLLEKAVKTLPVQDQTLLSLFYYENMSLRDIAFVTDSKPTTVGSRLSRIRNRLYHIIKQIAEQ